MKSLLVMWGALLVGVTPCLAQERGASPQSADNPRHGHEPPAQAYTDCAGKKAGDAVQHTTPQGKVAATCEASPKGLVARPLQPRSPGASSSSR